MQSAVSLAGERRQSVTHKFIPHMVSALNVTAWIEHTPETAQAGALEPNTAQCPRAVQPRVDTGTDERHVLNSDTLSRSFNLYVCHFVGIV